MALGYVGVLTIRVEMPWVGNLKEKRALVRPVVERLKVRFPLTVARLDGLNAHDWEVIGVATISNDYGWVEETLRMAADYIAKEGPYRVTHEEVSITPLGDGEDPDEDDPALD
ncbi:DUF503 domain-containing protein [Deinococcus multiflagellatus]|uniref:DUF503 domain-containing protein n=1 Tax=Deinococcus multiflagellatus TaxID=1656887 RepID=A0ABW1ZIV4_9DEIO|nr:DUF503 family protein [Deinococcus multiflagellatus]MBZ9713045.1 DUF503 family protein [Deinococcus multiflagellatus]